MHCDSQAITQIVSNLFLFYFIFKKWQNMLKQIATSFERKFLLVTDVICTLFVRFPNQLANVFGK